MSTTDVVSTGSRETLAYRKASRALGKAVHPEALNRLFELCPTAFVKVVHRHYLPGADRWTEVRIYPNPDGGVPVQASAIPHPNDQYNRRYGIDLAFRRALRKVKQEAFRGTWNQYDRP